MAVPAELANVVLALGDAGVECLVVGGLAAVFHGAPVVTNDIDIVHCRSDDNMSA